MSFSNTQSVVQLYIPDPLLYQQRKIDFRVYVLLLGDQCYLYPDGIVRMAGLPYTLDDLSTQIHLTNTSLNGNANKLGLLHFLDLNEPSRQPITKGIRTIAQLIGKIS